VVAQWLLARILAPGLNRIVLRIELGLGFVEQRDEGGLFAIEKEDGFLNANGVAFHEPSNSPQPLGVADVVGNQESHA